MGVVCEFVFLVIGGDFMSDFSRFMKGNKVVKNNTFFAATKSLCDEDGLPMQWEIRPISSTENDLLRDECTIDIPINGRNNSFRQKLSTTKYILKMICSSVVYPNLNDKVLQDSYGVMCPEDLIRAMIDDPGEYGVFANFIQKFNGFVTISDEVDQAKK